MEKLLQTKLMPPRLHANLISRRDLLERLNDGLTRKLILVTAPTGFGKTTLVGEWISGRMKDEGGSLKFAWVSLGAGDNDPVRFWSYVIAALRTFDISIGKNALAALQTSQPVSLHAILTPLINDLSRLSGTSVLILEDYHAISSSEIHASISFLLQHLPAPLHLVLISRVEPGLPLAILRARDELVELDASSLRFNLDETEAFLRKTVPTELPPSTAAKLQERTEGWAAGLRLAARSLQDKVDRDDVDKFIQTFSGGHRYVADYLIQEVFEIQPEPVQDFLLKTCFLSRLAGSLCDAVTQTTGGAEMLEQIERENLFLDQLQDSGERVWYRYNPLFAESIQVLARQRLGEAYIQSVFERASGWYELEGLYDEAVEAALAAKLYERAIGLIERFVEINDLTESHTLSRWLEQIPGGQLLQHPQLSFSYAQVILYTSDRFAPATAARLEPLLGAAETAWSTAEDTRGLGALYSFRGLVAWWQGDFQKAFDYAHRSLELIPDQEVLFRGSSLLIATYEALNEGRILDAQDLALEARAMLGAAQNIYGVLAALQMLGEVFYWQGEMAQADQLNRQIIAEALEASWGESMLDDQGLASLSLANGAYEQNDLENARQLAERALDLGQQRGNELLQAQAVIRLAHIQTALGNPRRGIDLVKALAARIRNPAWLREVQCAQALLSIRAHETGSLEWWLSVINGEKQNVLPVQKEREAFTMARMWISAAKPGAALEALNGWQEDAARYGRVRSQVEALCLEALAHDASFNPQQAAQALVQALQIGEPKGFRRLFLDEGMRMAALLQSVLPMLTRQELRFYARTLLQAFPPDLVPGQVEIGSGVLVEPLSRQEMRVLRLLAAGLSNAEIAREMVVSTNTIKTQVQSIYRKLNVNSRDEARRMVDELNLLNLK
jgi:LuxR family maltose regulon positive regulatory protein